MATKTETKPKAEAKGKAAPAAETKDLSKNKYGIADLEAATGLKAASIRVGLRESSFTKTVHGWGWNTKAELDQVIAFFKDRAARKPAMTPAAAPKKQPSAPGAKPKK